MITGQQAISMVQGESVELTNALFTYGCEAADTLTIQSGNGYVISGNSITPDSDFTGELSVGVIANKGNVSSESFDVVIKVEAKPEPEPEPEPVPTPETKSSGSIFWLLLIVFVIPLRHRFVSK